MTSDQMLPAAVGLAILILVVVGLIRVAGRRRGANEDTFGAGGVPTVAIGARGVTRTELAPMGVVRVVSEEWTARSGTATVIAAGTAVRVVSQDGLTLVVEPEHAGEPATGGA